MPSMTKGCRNKKKHAMTEKWMPEIWQMDYKDARMPKISFCGHVLCM
jgi:hypothetical protein